MGALMLVGVFGAFFAGIRWPTPMVFVAVTAAWVLGLAYVIPSVSGEDDAGGLVGLYFLLGYCPWVVAATVGMLLGSATQRRLDRSSRRPPDR